MRKSLGVWKHCLTRQCFRVMRRCWSWGKGCLAALTLMRQCFQTPSDLRIQFSGGLSAAFLSNWIGNHAAEQADDDAANNENNQRTNDDSSSKSFAPTNRPEH